MKIKKCSMFDKNNIKVFLLNVIFNYFIIYLKIFHKIIIK